MQDKGGKTVQIRRERKQKFVRRNVHNFSSSSLSYSLLPICYHECYHEYTYSLTVPLSQSHKSSHNHCMFCMIICVTQFKYYILYIFGEVKRHVLWQITTHRFFNFVSNAPDGNEERLPRSLPEDSLSLQFHAPVTVR